MQRLFLARCFSKFIGSGPFVLDSDIPLMSVREELLLMDVDTNQFHSLWEDLYHETAGQEGFVEMSTQFPRRLIGKFAVRIGSKRLWTPLLIDTGAPRTLFSSHTLDKFGIQANSYFQASVGHLSISAETAPGDTHFSDLNILGMDVLERAIPTWPDSLCQQLQAGLRLRPEDIAKGNTRPPIN
jgi:hypothetical protein